MNREVAVPGLPATRAIDQDRRVGCWYVLIPEMNSPVRHLDGLEVLDPRPETLVRIDDFDLWVERKNQQSD